MPFSAHAISAAASAPEAAPVLEPEVPFDPLPSRPKMVRPGTLMDTGDSMPRTEFHRPNPLDSDVIMDATARLLASKPVYQYYKPP